jgi:hypothetical protein
MFTEFAVFLALRISLNFDFRKFFCTDLAPARFELGLLSLDSFRLVSRPCFGDCWSVELKNLFSSSLVQKSRVASGSP